jgi:para-aminobenzoate synthetase component I
MRQEERHRAWDKEPTPPRDRPVFPNITGVVTSGEILATDVSDHTFLEHARRAAALAPSVVLLSGGNADAARYSIAAWAPVCLARTERDRTVVSFAAAPTEHADPPLDVVDALLDAIRLDAPDDMTPFRGGLIGYLAYELNGTIERLPRRATDDRDLPVLFLMLPSRLLVHDRREGVLRRFRMDYTVDGRTLPPIPDESTAWSAAAGDERITSTFSREAYEAAVRRVIEHIAAGDVYQINLSQRYSAPLPGDAFAFWTRLYHHNPAPYYAFVNAGDHAVLSTSMERFLRSDGARIVSQPIKGTRPRGATPEEDAALRDALLHHPKDAAELSMIVDLVRNDLGKVCAPGSVRVAEHKRIDAYRNVFHLSSIVEGALREDVTTGDILRAAFPAGSITGCPKIRAMELIDALEPVARHVYTGSIGYLGCRREMDLSVAIRTAIVKDGMARFSVGGGVVYDSDPAGEYRETLHKARAFFDVLRGGGDNHD